MIRILHLEDDAADAELVAATLGSTDYEVTRVQTEAQFCSALRGGGIDLVLGDFRLPGFDGMEALQLVRRSAPEVPFVFVSGVLGEEAAIEALTRGATDYIPKQRLSSLPAAVRRALHEADNARERRKAEQRLALMSFALDSVHEAAFMPDESGRFLYVNQEACLSLGHSADELTQLRVWDVNLDVPMTLWRERWRELKTTRSLTMPGRHRTRLGRVIPVELYIKYIEYEDRAYALTLARDVTERRQQEEEAARRQQELASLAIEVSLAEERERRRIAAQLHDEVGQNMLLAKMKLALAESASNEEIRAQELAEAVRLLDQSIRGVRSLTVELVPPVLAGAGLEAALEWLARRMEVNYGLKIDLVDDHRRKPLTDELRSVVYQSVRELLINAAKHAGTKEVRIELERVGDQLNAVVEDHGVGFSFSEGLPATPKEGGFGLFNVLQRIRHLGGEVELVSAPGRGTRVTLCVPLQV